MKKSECRKMKGGAALFILGFLVVFSLLLAVITHWYIADKVKKITVKVDIAVKASDRGSWLLSLLKSTADSKTYSELLGGVQAENHKEITGKHLYKESGQKSLEALIEKTKAIENIERSLEIKGAAPFKIPPGGTSNTRERYEIDIAVPGGRKVSMEVKEG